MAESRARPGPARGRAAPDDTPDPPCRVCWADRAATLGGVVLVRPFDVPGYARIGVILDPVGAQLGLWEHHRGP